MKLSKLLHDSSLHETEISNIGELQSKFRTIKKEFTFNKMLV